MLKGESVFVKTINFFTILIFGMLLGSQWQIYQDAKEYILCDTEKKLWIEKANLLEERGTAPCCSCDSAWIVPNEKNSVSYSDVYSCIC